MLRNTLHIQLSRIGIRVSAFLSWKYQEIFPAIQVAQCTEEGGKRKAENPEESEAREGERAEKNTRDAFAVGCVRLGVLAAIPDDNSKSSKSETMASRG